MRITVTEHQLELIDRVLADGALGGTRDAVLRSAVLEHTKYLLSGGEPYDAGGRKIIEVDKPRYGAKRYELVLQPVTGKAVPVHAGEVLRLVQLVGGQCVDFNGYNLHDYKEYLNCGFNRMKGMSFGKGTIVWSGSPRARPMYAIVDHSTNFDQYYAGHRCNAIVYEMEYGFVDHPNCQDTFAETIREYGLTPDDVHTSYNLWMHTTLDPDGRRQYHWNRAKEGDYVDLLALFDTLSVPVICGGDLGVVNNFNLSPMLLQVFEASPSTQELVNRVQGELGRYKNQLTPADFKAPAVRAERELRPDPSYSPVFRPAPKNVDVEVDVTAELRDLLQSLLQTGIYGSTEAEAVVSCFFRWFELNRIENRQTRLSFRER